MVKIRNKYDVVIVGSGIGSLICGCYLSKAGMKILIVEKNERPGGYCVSIEKNKIRFNLGITSMGNYSQKSRIKHIFDEIGISDQLNIGEIDPANEIFMPDFSIKFSSQVDFVIDQFCSHFSSMETRIRSFFDYILGSNISNFYLDLKDVTFSDFLDQSFQDDKLKAAFCFFLSALGVSAKEVSALSAIVVFKEFIMKGNSFLKCDFIDKLPNLLKEIALRNGADIVFDSKVERIGIINNCVKNVLWEDNNVEAGVVISGCDPIYTYRHLIGRDQHMEERLNSLCVSNSAFILYATIKKGKMDNFKSPNLWFCDNYDVIDDMPSVLGNNDYFFRQHCIFVGIQSRYNACGYPADRDAVFAIINAKYMDELFWQKEGERLEAFLLNKLRRFLNLALDDILTSSFITPAHLANLTCSLGGSIRGWASIIKQNSKMIFPAKSLIENLYFTGQWVTNDYAQGGLTVSAINGKATANLAIKDYKNKGVLLWN